MQDFLSEVTYSLSRRPAGGQLRYCRQRFRFVSRILQHHLFVRLRVMFRYVVRPLVLKFKVLGDKDITTKILDFDVIFKICFYSQRCLPLFQFFAVRTGNIHCFPLPNVFFECRFLWLLPKVVSDQTAGWFSCFYFPNSLKGGDTNGQCDDLLFTSAYHHKSRRYNYVRYMDAFTEIRVILINVSIFRVEAAAGSS